MSAATTGDAKRCGASMAGHPISVEYATGRDDEGPFVNVLAVHMAGRRIPAHWFGEDAIKDWERECEAAEITSEECSWGIPTPDSTAPWQMRRAA